MSRPELAYPSLTVRVYCWQQEVFRETQLYLQAQRQRRLHPQPSRHAMKLRSSASHSQSAAQRNPANSAPSLHVLAPTSANPRNLKRKVFNNPPPDLPADHNTTNKRWKAMDKGKSPMKEGGLYQEQTTSGGAKRRGRPPGSKNKPKADDAGLQDDMARLMMNKPDLAPSMRQSQEPSSPTQRTRTTSSGKSRGKQMDQPVSLDQMVVDMLKNFKPPVLLRTVQEILEARVRIPHSVLNLRTLVKTVPPMATPEELKASS
ncbi:MAG: hypothetical protein LQ342_008549 [Letrouitia transgressa]|nr:MAG: hypothetical protein LQ342_008549 [Letrouitia transgressa]